MSKELLDAFWAYERALMSDDIAAMDGLFVDDPGTLRGDGGGLLVGHAQIGAFRRVRGGAPPRQVVDVQVRPIDETHALIVAVTAPASGGRGLQTQLWERTPAGWAVAAAHVSPPPATFDRSVWRVVGDPLVAPTSSGALDGETVAAKDLFAVAGFAVGGGVPAYLAEQQPQVAHATAVQRLLDAGAAVRGIARTDQFAYSLDGDNPHYGAPVNAVVPGGLPGGSSSGSATAVALGAATIGLATDTAGSVRVPASYQGLWGLRTTHGAVPTDGVLPLAPDFDTVGLLTRTPDRLTRAATALLDDPLTDPSAAPLGDGLRWDQFRDELPMLVQWQDAFRVHQAFQAWQAHGAWLTAHPGAVLGSVATRFAIAAAVTTSDDEAARATLAEARARLDELLDQRVLVLPSAAGAAPRIWSAAAELEAARTSTLRLTCLAGITGRPVVSAPLTTTPDGPVGTSYLGPRGSDVALIRQAAADAAAVSP